MTTLINSSALASYLRHWAEAPFSCEPSDRELAERGVRLAYRAAGLAPPQRIIWCGSPVGIATQIGAASASRQIGRSVRTEVVDAVRDEVRTLAEIFWKEIACAASRPSAGRAVSGALCSAAVEDADVELFRLSTQISHLATRLLGCPSILPRTGFREVAAGPDELAALGIYQYLHDEHHWRMETRRLRGLWKIASAAGWFAPFERVCWLAERPLHVRFDGRGRLHCADGPAIRYPDGATTYAWKGVRVPAWIVERPETVTPEDIDSLIDPVLRDAMIDIMTPERFIASGGAARVSVDATGVLWRKLWSYRGVTLGSWSAVEVIDGTPARDGSRKRHILRVPAHVKTAREAVAWTYGLTAEQYAGLELRT